MGLCSRKDPTWGCSWRSRGRHFVPDFWCVMGVFAGRKASSLCNCLVGLSPLFKKLATFELQICTTHRVGDLLRAERSFKLAARPECTWTSRGFALKRYSSADVLTRPVPLRRIFRTIADGSLDGCWTCSRHWIESADCLHTSPVPQRQIFLAGILPALPQFPVAILVCSTQGGCHVPAWVHTSPRASVRVLSITFERHQEKVQILFIQDFWPSGAALQPLKCML
ncbi:uncharacterized protein LOC119404519 isoform X2 [Rhipicephalus sanguineus]|uniref:uncharacterized protein LOC119404519 isoform X2 n=1 Tax=Rhipicephalus sanguineus TaxID=34632 RepID=UPI0020C26CC4|nr:uncharacterized protein LOC119404519 isoform X2 [Rhipicephalus sanguineus]